MDKESDLLKVLGNAMETDATMLSCKIITQQEERVNPVTLMLASIKVAAACAMQIADDHGEIGPVFIKLAKVHLTTYLVETIEKMEKEAVREQC